MLYDEYYMEPQDYQRMIEHKYLFREQVANVDEETEFAWALEDAHHQIMLDYYTKAKAYREKKMATEEEEPIEVNLTSSIKVK